MTDARSASSTTSKPRFATAKDFIAEWNRLGEISRAKDQMMQQIILEAQVYYDPELWSDLVEGEKMAVLVAARKLGFLASGEAATPSDPAVTVVTTTGTFTASPRSRSRMGHAGGKRGRWGR